MRYRKYFNNPKAGIPQRKLANRRDADKLILSAHKLNLLLFFTVLHDKHGFGKKRLEKVSSQVNDLMYSYNKGYINLEDLNSTLYEETGINIL